MARKKRQFEKRITDVEKFIGSLRYKDLKRECVIRGMEFDDVIGGDFISLTNWLSRNFYSTITYELLDYFDDYQENLIKELIEKRGDPSGGIMHPSLRLGYVAEKNERGEITRRKRVKTLVKKKRLKRQRTAQGIFTGTKKAYVFELQQRGLSKEEVIKIVLEKYPDASHKSIGIWFNKAKKTGNAKGLVH